MNKLKGAIFGLLALSGAGILAADPLSRLSTWQKEVKGRTNGVYEIDGCLYIHVQAPVDLRDGSQRQKMCAVLAANDLLRKWAMDVFGMAGSAARGLNWQVNFDGQEFTGQDGKTFWLVQIVDKDELLKAIQASVRTPFPSPDRVCRKEEE